MASPMNPTTISEATSFRVVEGVQEVEVTLSAPLVKGGARFANTFLDCLPSGQDPAISSMLKGEQALSYDDLRRFLAAQDLCAQQGIRFGDRIAVVMPNGPEMAVTLLLCFAKAIAVPLEPSLSEGELAAAFEQLAVAHCLCLKQHKVYDDHIRSACKRTEVSLKYLVKGPKHAGHVLWVGGLEVIKNAVVGPPVLVEMTSGQVPLVEGSSDTEGTWTDLDAPAMLLRTSGTTSKPKVVPCTLRGMLTGSTCIAEGLGLRSTDQCLNVMPYTHIGGISCNLLGSLMAGASVRCSPGFDPARFLGWLEEFQPTWYYAVPTIHMAVRLASSGQVPKHSLRFIRNGAANLTDADARAMQALFGCPILPTYSMSECMPIAQPPKTYNLDKPGTVGVPIASSLRIVGADGRSAAAAGKDGEVRGEVCISGPVVAAGYLDNVQANEESYFEDSGRRWFRTGDVGYIDSEGYVFLTGRCKELIKRGGEQVSPYEVEEVLSKHPAVQVAVVFAVPNEFWGEEVAAAVVLKAGFSERAEDTPEANMQVMRKRPSLNRKQSWSSLNQTAASWHAKRPSVQSFTDCAVGSKDFMKFAAGELPDAKLPRQIKIVSEDQLPKTGTKKYQRVGLWEKLGLQAVDLHAKHALGSEPIGGAEAVPPPVDVSPAIRGARCFFAVWVIFVHTGAFPPWVAIWRQMSMSMPAFFLLAGFMLEKATTRPIADTRKYFRSRFIASHPLFVFALVMHWFVPLLFGASLESLPVLFILGFYTWGYPLSLFLWFTLIYNGCIFLFPWAHDALNNWRIFNLAANPTEPLCGGQGGEGACSCSKYACSVACWVGVLTICIGVTNEVLVLLSPDPKLPFWEYHFLPLWFSIFVCGMMTFKVFEQNRRGLPTGGGFQGWGRITDLLTLGFCMLLALQSFLVIYEFESTSLMLSRLWHRPGRFCTPYICIWIYGLATGQGVVARVLSTDFLAKTLSPATYAMYLFHYPLLFWWLVITRSIVGISLQEAFAEGIGIQWWEYSVAIPFVCWFSWYVTLYWSEKFSVIFQKIFNCAFMGCCCFCTGVGILCWKSEDAGAEEGTMLVVLDSLSSLTGADADATSKLTEVGLDSFGAGALVGLLVSRLPGLQLRAVDVYEMETVGDLVTFIDKKLSKSQYQDI